MIEKESPLETVFYLNKTSVLDVDDNQLNRYCILLNSNQGKEAYYFSTAIYNEYDLTLVKRQFYKENQIYKFTGSNCTVNVTPYQISLNRDNRKMFIKLEEPMDWRLNNGILISSDFTVIPTYNGISIKGDIKKMTFNVKINFEYENIREAHNCVCFMETFYKPIAVFSGLYCIDCMKKYKPINIQLHKTSEKIFNVSLYTEDVFCNECVCEINFYESKLIQDTAVSSKHNEENNAFSPVAFIGQTDLYGTQWLYSKLDFTKLFDLKNKNIYEIKLYIPYLYPQNAKINVCELTNRFCSLGTNWNNKIVDDSRKTLISFDKKYICIDLKDSCIRTNELWESFGMLIKLIDNQLSDYLLVSTGDSYTTPSVLYVKYKK